MVRCSIGKTYSWSEASGALQLLKSKQIPIVFCSSKTRVEQAFYQAELDIHDPFIVENGSAIVIPQDHFDSRTIPTAKSVDGQRCIELSQFSAEDITSKLRHIRQTSGLDFVMYSDMSDQELGSLTGLALPEVQRARQREYSETIMPRFDKECWNDLQSELEIVGLKATSGGRLATVTDAECDKSRAVQILTRLYRQQQNALTTVGLGDSPNDRDMLTEVDVAYQVKRPDGTWVDMNLPGVHRVGIGPQGWQEAVYELLAEPVV